MERNTNSAIRVTAVYLPVSLQIRGVSVAPVSRPPKPQTHRTHLEYRWRLP